jgi:hypothetical protein
MALHRYSPRNAGSRKPSSQSAAKNKPGCWLRSKLEAQKKQAADDFKARIGDLREARE